MGSVFITRRGGDSGLNFNVVGGTSAPENPSENTIWINTDVTVTGWTFSRSEPESPTEGHVWIYTGTASKAAFNALKRNAIQVYPLYAKQYIGDAWVDKTAMSYQNGAWNSWITYLFQNGDQNEALTGGWSSSIDDLDADGWTRGTYYAPSSDYPGGTEIGQTLIVKIHGNTNLRPGSVAVGTRNTVDLTQYSKIKAVCNFTQHSSCTAAPTVRLAVHASLLTPCKTSYAAYVDIPQGASEVELDVSEISGLYHVILGGHTADDCPAYGGDLYVSAVSIE